MDSEFRIEQDSMGELEVPADALWGAQTQRAIDNFPVSGLVMPGPFIQALGQIKQAAAMVNLELGLLPENKAIRIINAASRVAAGEVNHALLELFYFNMANTYHEGGYHVKAYEYMEKYVNVKDSLNKVETNNTVRELEAKFQNEQKKKEILKLNSEKDKQRIVIYSVAIGAGIVLILLFIIYNRLKLTKRQKIIIEETNI